MENTSIWKKEITFRRKPKQDPADAVSAVAVHPAASESPQAEYDHVLDPLLPPLSPRAEPASAPRIGAPTEPAPAQPATSTWATPSLAEQPVVETDIPPVAPPVEQPSVPSSPWSLPGTSQPDPAVEEPSVYGRERDPALEAHHEQETAPFEFTLPPPADSQTASPAGPWATPVTPPVDVAHVPQPPALEPAPEVPAQTSEAEPLPSVPTSEVAQEEPPALSRREQRDADRQAKELKKRAERIAKEERKANPARHTRVVGLKVGASQIAAAEVINKAGPRVVRIARMPLGRGVVVGESCASPTSSRLR